MPMNQAAYAKVAVWDPVIKLAYEGRSDVDVDRKGEEKTLVCADETNTVYERLYQQKDRRKHFVQELAGKQAAAERRRFEERLTRSKNTHRKYGDQWHKRVGRDFDELATYKLLGEKIRAVEEAKETLVVTRQTKGHYPLGDLTIQQQDAIAMLSALGDANRNAAAINTLLYFSHQQPAVAFGEAATKIREKQRRVMQQFRTINGSERECCRRVVTQLTPLIMDGLSGLNLEKYSEDQDLRAVVAEHLADFEKTLAAKGMLADILQEITEVFIDSNCKALETKLELLALDLEWSLLLNKFKINQFHIRGFRTDLRDEMDAHWRFKNTEPSTSLKFKLKRTNFLFFCVNTAKRHVLLQLGATPPPVVLENPDLQFLERGIGFHTNDAEDSKHTNSPPDNP